MADDERPMELGLVAVQQPARLVLDLVLPPVVAAEERPVVYAELDDCAGNDSSYVSLERRGQPGLRAQFERSGLALDRRPLDRQRLVALTGRKCHAIFDFVPSAGHKPCRRHRLLCARFLRNVRRQQTPPPFANAVELQAEIVSQLKELNGQIKEQNSLLRSGRLQVIVVDKNAAEKSPAERKRH